MYKNYAPLANEGLFLKGVKNEHSNLSKEIKKR